MHCKAHQFGDTPVNTGNCLADKVAKEAAGGNTLLALPEKYQHLDKEAADYQAEEEKLAKLLDVEKSTEGQWVTPSKQVIIPQHLIRKITEEQHKVTHWGRVYGRSREASNVEGTNDWYNENHC